MTFLLSLLPWIAYYLMESGKMTGREVAAILVAITAAGPLLNGGLLLFQANAHWHEGRAANPFWSPALANLAIGGLLGLLAAWLSGRLRRTGPKYVTVQGIVTSVEPIAAGGKVHWRVGFAYFTPDNVAYQSVDEVYVAGLQPRDSCAVVYPPDQPDLGTLRSFSKPPRHSAEAAPPSMFQDQASG